MVREQNFIKQKTEQNCYRESASFYCKCIQTIVIPVWVIKMILGTIQRVRNLPESLRTNNQNDEEKGGDKFRRFNIQSTCITEEKISKKMEERLPKKKIIRQS